MKLKNFLNLDKLWDLWCILSLIGIWPRFIEPNSLKTNKLNTNIPNLPQPLNNLKILQISDLHLNQGTFTCFLEKIKRKITALNPDLIVFTGDFLCYSKFPDKARLQHFFQTIPKARYGNYAILGNHDYQEYGYINSQGDYDVGAVRSDEPIIVKGFKRIFSNIIPTKKYNDRVKNTPFNSELIELLKTTNFQLLHNETIQIPIENSKLNLCGLGEYILDHFKPEEAFRNYDKTYPGIILTHNPDTIPLLRK